MKLNKTWMAAAAALSVFTLCAQAGGGMRALKQLVTVGRVTMHADMETRHFPGLVLSPSVVNVVARVNGEILEVGFKDGAAVKKGQVLYRLDPVKYQAAVKNAEAKVAEYKAKEGYAQRSYDRTKTLFDRSAASLDTKESSESVLAALKAALMAAEASLISAKDELQDCTIISPIDGIAGATNYTYGNYLTPASGKLVTVIQSDPMRVRFPMSIRIYMEMFRNFADMQKNAVVKVVSADGKEYPFEGTVELIDNQANRNTDSVLVYVLFKNPERVLIPNSTVTVVLMKRTAEKYPSIPPAAVLHDAKGAYVYTVSAEDKAVKRYVVLGGTNGEYQIIRSGLKNGEKIVVDGTQKLFEGVSVEYAGQQKVPGRK